MRSLVLGSSSPYRKELLNKLGLPFQTCSPDIDEKPHPNETPHELVLRLALTKAEAVAQRYPDSLIISSDQVSVLDGVINGKPGNKERAFAQLKASSGNTVTFHTSLCLYDAKDKTHQLDVEPYYAHFRTLSDEAIHRYIEKENPLNCAGSFKSEGLGIALFDKLEGRDNNTLVGLPLILLIQMLNKKDIDIP